MKRILASTLPLLVLFGVTLRVDAQTTDGTISGTVSDPTGAMVPGAEVTVTNEATGVSRVVKTNDTGFYTVPTLPLGTYTVKVTVPGFKTYESRGIDLHVREEKLVPITLEVGAVTQTVEVAGEATIVELRSGEVSNLVGARQMSELPLNGRSFVQLTLLVPGASISDTANVRNTGLLAGVDISMSGSPANANAWLVDGANNVDQGSGRTILVYPSVDSIEEFKVQRNAYGPEMSSYGGAQINLVTKSGGNAFHGSAYEFLRNDALNATNFFLNRSGGKKGKLRYNNFGYSFGGPIKKDKLFFFWSEEWRREKRGIVRMATVPTALERQGNFSGPNSYDYPDPIDPFTGLEFPNDTIPADQLSPAGLALLDLWPAPTNNNLFDNWVAAVTTPIRTRQEQIRVDYNPSTSTQLMVRYTQDAWDNLAPNYGSEGGLWGDDPFPAVDTDWVQPSKLFAVRLTNSIGPSMVNQFQFSYSNNRIYMTRGVGEDINARINAAIPEVFPGPENRSHAVFWGTPLGQSFWHAAPWDNAQDLFVWTDDFTKISGNHTFKLGGLLSHKTKSEDCCGASDNQAQFWGPTAVPGGAGMGGGWGHPDAPGNGGIVTGNGLADLLLKGTYWGSNEHSAMPRSLIEWHDYEVYFADTWRAHPRLTLNYGFRWAYLPQTFQQDSRLGNFVPELYNPSRGADSFNGMVYPETLTATDVNIPSWVPRYGGKALRWNRVDVPAVRLGIAWDPTGAGKWAIRAGYGWFFGRSDISGPIGGLIMNPPFNAAVNWACGRPLDTIAIESKSFCVVPEASLGTPNQAADFKYNTQGSYQWNFTIERELWRDTKLEVAYVGNRGHHLPINWNMNYVPSPKRLEFARRYYAPGGTPEAALDANELRVLFPLKGDQSLIFASQGGNSIYHALQVFANKRFSQNYSFQVSYSWSKLLALSDISCCVGGDNTRIHDPENFSYDRGPATFDRTHILTVNSVYNLPTLTGKHPVLKGFAGGWELSGIYSYGSGLPLTITGGPNTGVSTAGASGGRLDLVGNPVGLRTAEQWFNTAAYVFPRELGREGYSSRGSTRGPGISNIDFNIMKNFDLPKEGWRIQFRAEFYNAFNHTQFLNVDTGYSTSGVTADLTTNTFDPDTTGNINPSFGTPRRARDPREIQLAIKFIF